MKYFYLAIYFLISNISLSGVSLRNGNFFMSYVDLMPSRNGKSIEIRRTYNSVVAKEGWFGVGWGSKFETYLEVLGDGSVVIYENGSGAENRFVPIGKKLKSSGSVAKIISKLGLKGKKAKSMKVSLSKDLKLRRQYEKRFKISGKVIAGVKYVSSAFGQQYLIVKGKKYIRKKVDGTEESFDQLGRIYEIKERSGYKQILKYKANSKLPVSISDNISQSISFTWNSQKKIAQLKDNSGKVATYKYRSGNVIDSMDANKNTYKYEYDNLSNLKKITYDSGKYMAITYHPKTLRATKVRYKNGQTILYGYKAGKKDPKHNFTTFVTGKNAAGEKTTDSYQYIEKKKNDGSYFLQTYSETIGGIRKITKYSSKNSLPILITRGKEKTSFKYDKEGKMTEKKRYYKNKEVSFYKVAYHKALKKIVRVVTNSGRNEYKYTRSGMLDLAKSNGRLLKFFYDKDKKLSKVLIKRKGAKKADSLVFGYDKKIGKASSVKLNNKGGITFKYDLTTGQAIGVDKVIGRGISTADVASVFREIVDVVKPTGVNLNI